MDRRRHLSDEQLAQFQDGELRGEELIHLESCAECRTRLHDLGKATSAFQEYLRSASHPLQPPPPRPWQSLSAIVAGHSQEKPTFSFRWIWMTAAAASLLGAFVFLDWKQRHDASARAQDLLTESSRMTRPPQGDISIAMRGGTILRPALLEAENDRDPSMERLRSAFTQANYSWRDPLSARSFLSWRSGLSKKRDKVNVVGEGSNRAYRVRTETPAGPLRAVSLTLPAAEMRPTAGSFDFVEDGPVEMSVVAKRAPETSAEKHSPRTDDLSRESAASPEDTLRVLAALHRIGADVDDPIVVTEDPERRRVVVRGTGLSAGRKKEIAQVLKGLPRAATDFFGVDLAEAPSHRSNERYVANLPARMRRTLEERSGGAVALQILTDEVLDASASLLARAHAMEVLEEKFPPSTAAGLSQEGRRILNDLHSDHAGKMRREIESIQAKLKPLLSTSNDKLSSEVPGGGKADVRFVPGAVRQLDGLLNRLLAGTYNDAEGEKLMDEIRAQLHVLDTAVQAQEGHLL